jgi:hypothetical protein
MSELEDQYQQLLRTLNELHHSGFCALEKSERAFQIAYVFWQKAEQIYQTKCFTYAECIYWNRHIRSGFIAELEYVLLMQYSLLFEPNPFTSEAQRFWIREMERIPDFIRAYPGFYHYFKSGYIDQERKWFLQSCKSYFPDTQALYHTYGDVLLGQLLALERYFIYSHAKMENLPPSGKCFGV